MRKRGVSCPFGGNLAAGASGSLGLGIVGNLRASGRNVLAAPRSPGSLGITLGLTLWRLLWVLLQIPLRLSLLFSLGLFLARLPRLSCIHPLALACPCIRVRACFAGSLCGSLWALLLRVPALGFFALLFFLGAQAEDDVRQKLAQSLGQGLLLLDCPCHTLAHLACGASGVEVKDYFRKVRVEKHVFGIVYANAYPELTVFGFFHAQGGPYAHGGKFACKIVLHSLELYGCRAGKASFEQGTADVQATCGNELQKAVPKTYAVREQALAQGPVEVGEEQLKWVKSSRWDWKGMLTLGSVGSLGFAMMSVQSRMMSMVMSGVRNMKNLRRTEKSKSALKQTRQSQCMKSGTSWFW